MATSTKQVFLFGEIEPDKNFLGGKGAGLARMTQLKLPVPPGFTIPTTVCIDYLKENKFHPDLMIQVREAMAQLEKQVGKSFGKPEKDTLPLLVSVRSGARISMPGMMDTILNLGLNDEIAESFIALTDQKRFVYDSYRRFIEMFGNVAMYIDRKKFEEEMDKEKAKINEDIRQVNDTDLDTEAMKRLVSAYKKVYHRELGQPFPQDPYIQLQIAIESVFKSWNNVRAIKYRKINRIPDNYGTAVNVQLMAYGNIDKNSGSGVGFTRNPSNGDPHFYAEFLTQAQGEDVVAGTRTPEDIAVADKTKYNELLEISKILEKEYRDMMDIEFTVEQGKLYMLQCRVGKRTADAAIKIAVDMVNEGLISKEEAVMRVRPEQIDQLLHPQIDPKIKPTLNPIGQGLNASPGSVVGNIVLSSSKAEELHAKDPHYPMILVAEETLAEDVGGMAASQGILTATGGKTSHAAVVARGMGKPCVVGVGTLHIKPHSISVGGQEFREGDILTLDGTDGSVYAGKIPLVPPKITENAELLLSWADSFATLKVRGNADTPSAAKQAVDFKAIGIGLTRTERMFSAPERLALVREMILAEDKETRLKALNALEPMQQKDFEEIFAVVPGPVTIRLLDPPLHEFLPKMEELMADMARMEALKQLDQHYEVKRQTLKRVKVLHEFNPMLGLRGARLGILYPEIYEMQVHAVIKAAIAERKRGNDKFSVEIMIPQVGFAKELQMLKEIVTRAADHTMQKEGYKIKYKFGTMLEVVRAILTADELAHLVDFMSYGTNDLTQAALSLSRDDAEKLFLQDYLTKGIIPDNPFAEVDLQGVGKLVKIGSEFARKTNPKIHLGICGEHGGDPASIIYFHDFGGTAPAGLEYVSASSFRVPVARLAAAHAALLAKQTKNN